MSRALLFIGVTLPIVSLLAAMGGFLPFDVALPIISVAFIVALVPGMIENYRNKRGWSKQSTSMTASGLLSMGTMFIMVGLPFTGLLTLLSGVTWVVLTVQAFVYGRQN